MSMSPMRMGRLKSRGLLGAVGTSNHISDQDVMNE